MSLQNKSEWEKEFVRRFVNTHGTHWRPLRGLWTEEVIEFIYEVISQREKEIAEDVKKMKRRLEDISTDVVDDGITLSFIPLAKIKALDEVLSILKH